MTKIYPLTVKRTTAGSSGITDTFGITITAADTNAAPTDVDTYAFAATYADDIIETTPPVFHHSSVAQSAAAGNTRSVNKPTATVDTDLLVAYVAFSAAGALTITAPAGWTQVGTTQTVLDSVLSLTVTLGVYAKIASGEPASWTWSTNTNFASVSATVLAQTGGALPANSLATTSATRSTQQTYGPVSGDVTGRYYVVGLASLTQTHANAGWSPGPTNLTDRTGDVSASGTNSVDLQVWSGLNGSAQGFGTKTESDVWISFSMTALSQPTALAETASLAFPAPDFADTNDAPTEGSTFTAAYSTPGSFTFTIPATTLTVECWGGGGGGGGGGTLGRGGGGGGGGYASSVISGLTVGGTKAIVVGTGGGGGAAGANGTSGTNSTWDSTIVIASGGQPGAAGGATGGTGGLANANTGSVTFNGGSGAAGGLEAVNGGGGGGGGAGTAGVGGAGAGNTGGTGGTARGGNGGTANGGAAPQPNGGGGDGGPGSVTSPVAGKAGARGEVRITWTAA